MQLWRVFLQHDDTGRPAGTPARDLSLADRMYPTKA